jgi:hypothetical protein
MSVCLEQPNFQANAGTVDHQRFTTCTHFFKLSKFAMFVNSPVTLPSP